MIHFDPIFVLPAIGMLFRVNKITSFVAEQIPKLRATLDDIEQVLDKRIDEVNIAAKSITAASIAANSITPAELSGNPQPASGTYTGDGTSNRVINLGFTPRHVVIGRVDTSDIFEAIGDGVVRLTQWWRSSAGVLSAGDTDWQGVITNGFKLGSAAGGGLSNANTKTYYYFAER